MRKIQKIIIIFYGLLVAFACIYVPWGYKASNGGYKFLGYSFIWQPVKYGVEYRLLANTVEFQRVILELIAITVVFAVLFALTLKLKKEQIEK